MVEVTVKEEILQHEKIEGNLYIYLSHLINILENEYKIKPKYKIQGNPDMRKSFWIRNRKSWFTVFDKETFKDKGTFKVLLANQEIFSNLHIKSPKKKFVIMVPIIEKENRIHVFNGANSLPILLTEFVEQLASDLQGPMVSRAGLVKSKEKEKNVDIYDLGKRILHREQISDDDIFPKISNEGDNTTLKKISFFKKVNEKILELIADKGSIKYVYPKRFTERNFFQTISSKNKLLVNFQIDNIVKRLKKLFSDPHNHSIVEKLNTILRDDNSEKERSKPETIYKNILSNKHFMGYYLAMYCLVLDNDFYKNKPNDLEMPELFTLIATDKFSDVFFRYIYFCCGETSLCTKTIGSKIRNQILLLKIAHNLVLNTEIQKRILVNKTNILNMKQSTFNLYSKINVKSKFKLSPDISGRAPTYEEALDAYLNIRKKLFDSFLSNQEKTVLIKYQYMYMLLGLSLRFGSRSGFLENLMWGSNLVIFGDFIDNKEKKEDEKKKLCKHIVETNDKITNLHAGVLIFQGNIDHKSIRKNELLLPFMDEATILVYDCLGFLLDKKEYILSRKEKNFCTKSALEWIREKNHESSWIDEVYGQHVFPVKLNLTKLLKEIFKVYYEEIRKGDKIENYKDYNMRDFRKMVSQYMDKNGLDSNIKNNVLMHSESVHNSYYKNNMDFISNSEALLKIDNLFITETPKKVSVTQKRKFSSPERKKIYKKPKNGFLQSETVLLHTEEQKENKSNENEIETQRRSHRVKKRNQFLEDF